MGMTIEGPVYVNVLEIVIKGLKMHMLHSATSDSNS